MPEKEGAEEKSTKSVVNKKQKQMMNTEEFSDRQRSDMKNILNKNFGDESTAEKTAAKVRASRAKEITGQSAVRDAQKYASGEYAKLGGGERSNPKSKAGSASTGGTNTKPVTGGPKENPKSLGGKSKGSTPVKVNIKKKPDLSKYFGEKIDPLNFGKSKRTLEQKQQARSQKQRTNAVFNTKKGLSDMKTGTQSSEFLKTKDAKKKPEDSQPLDEEGYDIARDMGRVKPSKDKKDATTMPPSKEMEKTRKVYKGPSALELIKKKYKGQIMDVGKKKANEELDLTQVAEAFGGYIVEQTTDEEKKNQQQRKSKKKFSPDIPSTVRVGGEENNTRKPTRTKQTSLDQTIQTGDPDYYRKQREKTKIGRDRYDFIPDKEGKFDFNPETKQSNIEKYARRMLSRKQKDSKSNVPIELTPDDLAKAERDARSKYGGRDAKRKSLLKQLTRKSPKPKVSLQEPQETKPEPKTQTQTQMGDGQPPKPPKVATSTGATGGGKEPSLVSKVAKFSKKNPATALLSFDALRKLIPSRSPFGVQGGRAGLRSAAR